MNVQTRPQFDAFINDLDTQETKVFDLETNGLFPYRGNHLISLSVYFPAVNRAYNLPFYHGIGQVEVKYTAGTDPLTPFEELSWQGKTKKQLYLDHWYGKFALSRPSGYFGNLPDAWLDEVRDHWGKGIYIGHNTRFDAHFLNAYGFPDMAMVYDTMIALHIVQEDWRNTYLVAPYTWSAKEAPSKDLVGMWATDAEGKLLTKLQPGNRQLKWQSALHGFAGATEGETGLFMARRAFEEQLVDYIMEHLDDPVNDSLLLARVKANKATPADMVKQRVKIASKVEVDDKANMWMLPSGLVADYAVGDVKLTWQLYEWCMTIIKQWHNEDLFEKQSRIHHFVAWEMERNGFRLDRSAAVTEIERLKPMISEVEETLARVAMEWGVEDFNANSPKQLLPFLNSGVLGQDYGTTLFPDWWDVSLSLGLKVYPNVRVSETELEDSGDELFGTGKKELERVADHPVTRLIKELRRMNKSANTYLKKWLHAADSEDIVRFSINDDGTVAGRASSSGDAGNGQNIPDRGGYTIKKAIKPYSDQWVFFAADYGQLELRLGAWIAESLRGLDPAMSMTRLFQSGEDMHSYVRDLIDIRNILFPGWTDEQIVVKIGYSLTHEKVNTPEKRYEVVQDYLRQVAKTMNFGLLYSGGARMLSNLLKIDEEPAGILVKKWRKLFPAFPQAQADITEEALTRRLRPDGLGYGKYVTQPISGRHRKLHLYKTEQSYWDGTGWSTFSPLEAAARKVWNNTDQGLGGFLAMYSAYRIGEELGRDNIKMFANIHDALEGFIHISHLEYLPRIGTIMIDWPEIVPALTVDLSGSKDGTWQGISKIKNMSKWIYSGGKDGY